MARRCPSCKARNAGLCWYTRVKGAGPTFRSWASARFSRSFKRCKDTFHGYGGWAR